MRRIKKSDRQREVIGNAPGLIASVAGIGLLPSAPGTWASAATLPVGWVISMQSGPWGLVIAALVVFAIGCWASERVIRQIETDDPSVIVIDEVAGQLLALVFAPLSWTAYLAAFVAFRFFDLTKIWPASLIDREIGGGTGAMADDAMAGVYAMLVIYAAVQLGWLV
ncbi:MAG: phosphatidylglycerophosphatase A [Micropepsaceae bacterium]